MILLTIMLGVAPQLLFAATLTTSINKEQQSRQAMGARHKAIITNESTSESINPLPDELFSVEVTFSLYMN